MRVVCGSLIDTPPESQLLAKKFVAKENGLFWLNSSIILNVFLIVLAWTHFGLEHLTQPWFNIVLTFVKVCFFLVDRNIEPFLYKNVQFCQY